MSPLGSSDEYWEAYLATAPTVKALVWRNAKDAIPADKELLRRWRIVSEAGEEPKKSDYGGFSKPIVDGLHKKRKFLNELVVPEKPPPEAGNDPPPPFLYNPAAGHNEPQPGTPTGETEQGGRVSSRRGARNDPCLKVVYSGKR